MKGPGRFSCLLSALALAAISWGVLATPDTAAAAKAKKRSPDGVWTQRTATGGRTAPGVALNARALARILAGAPSEAAAAAGARRPVLSLPLPEGGFARFRIEKSPIFSAVVQKRFRSIKTYRGRGVDDPTATARLDVTPRGFHAQILSSAGTVLVDPAGGSYRSVRTQGLAAASFPCGSGEKAVAPLLAPAAAPSGDSVREYRLAVVGTGEFAVGSGGAANARIVTMVNRAVGIYEREVAVRFTLLPPIIFPNPGSDPFPTGSVVDNLLLTQNQGVLDGIVGPANYDIGHVVTLGSGGGLALGAACSGLKAQGGSALSNPADESFDVEAFSHVIGHQLGAHHTFNGTTDACGPERNAGTAYEPGSGSTLMSFAGLCDAENVQTLADTYFHTASFDEITNFRDDPLAGAACGTVTATGDAAPVVDAGPDFTIPRGTPFTLTAIGSDLDPLDALTFCWEQFDLGVLPPNDVFDPLFRSLPPNASPARTFPAMADLLSGTTSAWERLPLVDRTMTFRVTVRDNRTGVNYDDVALNVTGEPFFITAPVSGGSLECGDSTPLAWQVGGGSVATDVRVLFSTDAGVSFGETLASTPNDGTEPVTVPKTLTPTARIKLEALGNVFFALSGPLTIADTLAPTLTAPPSLYDVECTSPEGASPDLGDAVATDLCEGTLTPSDDAPDVFDFGTTTVTYTATDSSTNSSTATQTVEVVDTTPPSFITVPADITAECASPQGTDVDLGVPVVSDVCDDAVALTNNAPPYPPGFPLGLTTVLWTAADNFDNEASVAQKVTVVDTTPPVVTLSLSPTVLWPPNHKLVTIRAAITVQDTCDAVPTVRLVSITSDEPDNGKGDGNTTGDIVGASIGQDDREFQLRAERSGGGDGRVYTVTYEARDASGNTTTRAATVLVPHDQGK